MFLYNMATHHTEILVVLQSTMQHTLWELTGDSYPERPYLTLYEIVTVRKFCEIMKNISGSCWQEDFFRWH